MLWLPLGVVKLHRDAVADQAVDLPVGDNGGHGMALVRQPRQRLVDGRFGDTPIQPDCRLFQPLSEDHLALVAPPRAVVQVVRIAGVAVEQVIIELLMQPLQDGLLNGVFGDEVGHLYSLDRAKEFQTICTNYRKPPSQNQSLAARAWYMAVCHEFR